MGYRSDVRIAIGGEKDDIIQFLTDFRLQVGELYAKHVKPDMKVHEADSGRIVIWFAFDNVKWYDGYEDVDVFTTLWNMVNEYDTLDGQFVRIGEETSDIVEDTHNDSWDFFSVSRAIRHEMELDNKPELLGLDT